MAIARGILHLRGGSSSVRQSRGEEKHHHIKRGSIGTVGGKGVYCSPLGLKGGQFMTAVQQFVVSHPDLAEKSYGEAMAVSLLQAYPMSDTVDRDDALAVTAQGGRPHQSLKFEMLQPTLTPA